MKPLLIAGAAAIAMLSATLVAVPLLFFAHPAAGVCGGTGSIEGQPVPPAVEAVAHQASQQTGIDLLVPLALSYRETRWGQARAGVPEDQALAWMGDLARDVDRSALVAGGTVAMLVGRQQGIGLGDWVNPEPVGGEHAIGFAQFLPSTWRQVAFDHPRPGGGAWDPYSPLDALTLAGHHLRDLLRASAGDLVAATQRFGTEGFQSALDELKRTRRTACAAGVTAGDPFGGLCRPATTQAYGVVEVFTPNGRHNGIDLACQDGAAIFSVTGGVVHHVASGCSNGTRDSCGGGYGNHVVVRFRGRIPGDAGEHDYYVVYGHLLEAPLVRQDQQVQPGTQLGHQGDSGLSWGSHLHFEVDRDAWDTVRSVDPSPLLPASFSGKATG